jgi:hypothetical protein
MFVYIENALGISIYKPMFQFHGKSLKELEIAVFKHLNISNNLRARIDVYSARLGCLSRNRLTSLNTVTEDVYIMLREVE